MLSSTTGDVHRRRAASPAEDRLRRGGRCADAPRPGAGRWRAPSRTTIGLSWVGNVQSRRDRAGAARLLEVNPRFPGTMPLTVAAGVDMPAICLAMALGSPAPSPMGFRDTAMVRYLEERFISPEELTAVPTTPQVSLARSG